MNVALTNQSITPEIIFTFLLLTNNKRHIRAQQNDHRIPLFYYARSNSKESSFGDKEASSMACTPHDFRKPLSIAAPCFFLKRSDLKKYINGRLIREFPFEKVKFIRGKISFGIKTVTRRGRGALRVERTL
jgi:hypothetical protein